MKKNQLLIVSGIIVAVGGYMIWKKLKSTNNSVPETTDTVIVSLDNMSIPDKDAVLKVGSKGVEVEMLQKALKNLKVDGIFGALTLARLKAVTGKNSITLNEYNDYVTKLADVNFIVGAGKHKSAKTLATFEADFLKAWVDAIKAVQNVFEYNGKNYQTQGGTLTNVKAGTFEVNGVTYRTSDGSVVKG